jgi:hypothetical protein
MDRYGDRPEPGLVVANRITNVIIRESDCFAGAGGDRDRGRARINGGRGWRFA